MISAAAFVILKFDARLASNQNADIFDDFW